MYLIIHVTQVLPWYDTHTTQLSLQNTVTVTDITVNLACTLVTKFTPRSKSSVKKVHIQV